VSIADLRY